MTLLADANPADNTVLVQIWRRIINPTIDTAVLNPTPSGTQRRYSLQLNALTPVLIPDVGQYTLYVFNPVRANNHLQSVSVKLYPN